MCELKYKVQIGARKDCRRKLKQNKMIIGTTLGKVNISAQEANINKVELFFKILPLKISEIYSTNSRKMASKTPR